MLSNQEACTLAKRCLRRARQRGASCQSAARIAATVLTRAAVDRGSRDNVTVRFFKSLTFPVLYLLTRQCDGTLSNPSPARYWTCSHNNATVRFRIPHLPSAVPAQTLQSMQTWKATWLLACLSLVFMWMSCQTHKNGGWMHSDKSEATSTKPLLYTRPCSPPSVSSLCLTAAMHDCRRLACFMWLPGAPVCCPGGLLEIPTTGQAREVTPE